MKSMSAFMPALHEVSTAPRGGPRRRLAATAAAALVLLLCSTACAGAGSQGNEPPLPSFSSYAWYEDGGSGLAQGVADDATDAEIQAAINLELVRRGLRQAAAGEADVLVAYTTWIESRVRANDPYFSTRAAEQVEIGTLTIDLLDPESGEIVWQGSTSRQLRVAAVLRGPFDHELTPTEAPRDWRAQELVARILRE